MAVQNNSMERKIVSFAKMGRLFLGCSLMLASALAAAQSWPSKPIRLVVPYPPGGSNDQLARYIGARLQETWGQPVVIDNKAGANSIIGNEFVARSPPDGYTLLINSVGGMAINPLLYPTLPYNPSTAFTPIGIVAIAPVVIAINTAVPANTLQEFIAYAKAHPGKLNNSAGSTISNVAAELFKQMADIRLTSIPYKGSAPSVAAVLAGDTQLVIVDAAAIAAQIRAGKIKGLAIAGPTRLSVLPDVPTVAEAGMPAYKLDAWVALFAPAGTPPELVNRISTEVATIMQQRDARETLGAALVPVGGTPEELGNALSSDLARYAPLVKSLNMKAD